MGIELISISARNEAEKLKLQLLLLSVHCSYELQPLKKKTTVVSL
jgi:hypothetical protein